MTYFLDGDKIETLKIILSPCLVNISHILLCYSNLCPIEIFFGWGQDRKFGNYLVPMLLNISNGDKIPIDMTLKIILSPCLENISDGDKIPLICFLNGDKIATLKIFLSPCLVNILMGTRSPLRCFLNGGKIKILKIILSSCLVKNI